MLNPFRAWWSKGQRQLDVAASARRNFRGRRFTNRRKLLLEPLEDRRVFAVDFLDPHPAPGNGFGHSVTPLSNGNVVITAPFDDAGGLDSGAVYLFNGATGALISTLRGSNQLDNVGLRGATALANGNFVVSSPRWRNGLGGPIVGAVTWASGTVGINGSVSSGNSLIGQADGDGLGEIGNVVALPNGNYVVVSSGWDNATATEVGAVTWANGSTGLTGTVSAANSLVGSSQDDRVGQGGIRVLSNGNYVVLSPEWNNGAQSLAGAVTWVNGSTGLIGTVSNTNSLVGSKSEDQIGLLGVEPLASGNFVVVNPYWDNGTAIDAGAVTWGSGTSGIAGAVSAANSLVGSATNDNVGYGGITALNNGNFVISSPQWNNGGIVDAGAATWASGTVGVAGVINSANSLVGERAADNVGSHVTALSNGNYVVASPQWNNGALTDAGAVTWGSGTAGAKGLITAANSIVGSAANHSLGSGGVKALASGNFVIASPNWDSGSTPDVGAVTWVSGAATAIGNVNAANSMVGSQANDFVGQLITPLANGHYVIGSPSWRNGSLVGAGAATWSSGLGPTVGVVSAANSLVGTTTNDQVGGFSSVVALPNGNYVLLTPDWDNGTTANVGAVTFGSGSGGLVGTIDASKSILGSVIGDRIGNDGLIVLANGNYLIRSGSWDHGSIVNAGAITWASGTNGIVGAVNAANSLVGSSTNDNFGSGTIAALANGNYVVVNSIYDNGPLTNAGSATWGDGAHGVVGPLVVPSDSSIAGGVAASNLQSLIVDDANGAFYVRFLKDGIVRGGSQTTGFATLTAPTLTAELNGGNLTITDTDAAGKANGLTVKRVNVAGVDYLQFSDAIENFASAPVTSPASVLANFNKTLRVPLSAITGVLSLNLTGGDDTLTLDLAGGGLIPTGGLHFHGGAPGTGAGDQLVVVGGSLGNVTHAFVNSSDGSLLTSSLGTIQYTGVEAIANRATMSALQVQLPATTTALTLADDGTTGNQLNRLSASNITTTDFANPTSLTLMRGTASDTLTMHTLADLTAGLTFGSSIAPLQSIQFEGFVNLAANASLTAFALGQINLATATSDLATSGNGSIALTAHNVTLANGASLTSAAGNITIDAQLQPIGSEAAVDISGSITSATGEVRLIADALRIAPTAFISANQVSLRPHAPARPLHLGGEDAAGQLGLTDAELDRVATANLSIGDATTGMLTVSAPVTRSAATSLHLQSSSTIHFTTGSLDSAGGNIALRAATIAPASAGVDVTTPAGLLTFGSGSHLALSIAGPAVDAEYQQLNVLGQVNLTGLSLQLSGTAPTQGESFVIVRNDGVDPVVGTFSGLPEGTLISVNGVLKRLTYVGGDGNDVALVANTPPTLDAINQATFNEDTLEPLIALSGITAGAESQALQVTASSSDPTLISLVTPNYTSPQNSGSLRLSLAPNAHGTATITVAVRDAGFDGVFHTADDGLTSRGFQVTISPVNDAPSFLKGSDVLLPFHSLAQTFPLWATNITPGPTNESFQNVTFQVVGNSNGALFSVSPAISSTGELTFTHAPGVIGSATITLVAKDDGGNLLGGSDTSGEQTFIITVNPAPPTLQVTHLLPTSTGFVIQFSREFDPTTLNLFHTQVGGSGPADIMLVSNSGVVRGSVVVDASRQRLAFVSTSGTLPADTYTLTLRSAADGFRELTSFPLDGNEDNLPGGDYVRQFQIDSPQPNSVTISLPNFARGPLQSVNVPAAATGGIPLTLSDGNGITSANFELRYDPSLLQITGATVAAGLPSGANVTINTSTPGLATFQFVSSTPLAAGTTHFVNLQASVPATAPYLQKHLLDLGNISLNGRSIPARDDDGIHVAAYFGDVTANGTLSAQDASQIARMAVGLDNGFAPYRLLDPTIIGDINGNGTISSLDIVRLLQVSVALPTPEVPALPIPAVSLLSGGPDPKLSIPTNLVANAGDELVVPVMIDSIVDLTGTGLQSADVVIYYDPAVFDVTSVTLGDLLNGAGNSGTGTWSVAARIDALAGRIFISTAGARPLEGQFVGELLKLHAKVKATAPAGSSAINLAASSRDPSRATQLNEGYLTLIPAPSNADNDPGVDGVLTIVNGGAPGASVPTATQAGQQLRITGTDGDDFIFVTPLSADLVRVRVGRHLFTEFPTPSEIIVDSLGGNDYVFVSPDLPTPIRVGAPMEPTGGIAAAESIADSVRAAGEDTSAEMVDSVREILSSSESTVSSEPTSSVPRTSPLTPHDLALLELLTVWTETSEENSSNHATPRRKR